MNLIIDQGNTRSKVAIFNESILIEQIISPKIDKIQLKELVANYKIKDAIVSSVRASEMELFDLVKSVIPSTLKMSASLSLPFNIAYKTTNTLGLDRIAAVAGAIAQFPNSNILVIDAGTAITYEIIETGDLYYGGNIAPGMQMRYNALHQFTGKLPLLTPQMDAQFIGQSTTSAIWAGVQNGIVFEIDGYCNQLQNKYSDLKIIITGGDADFFASKVKNPIFVNLNLVVEGLNRILKHNV